MQTESGRLEQKILLRNDAESLPETFGMVRIQYWSQAERLRRALRFSGMCLALAVGSILIPLLHFVLVPLFLLATPILFYFIYQQKSLILGGEGICPRCTQVLQIEQAPHRFPRWDLCSSCLNRVWVNRC